MSCGCILYVCLCSVKTDKLKRRALFDSSVLKSTLYTPVMTMLLMWNCVRGTIVMSLWYATSLHYKIKTSIQSFFQFSLISCFWNKPENRICVLKCFHILKIVNISQQSRQQCSFLKVTERQTGNPERFSFQVKSNVEFRMRIFRLWHKFYLFKMTSVFSNVFFVVVVVVTIRDIMYIILLCYSC